MTSPHKTDQQLTPPRWDLVQFAVTCARCGQDLHGQTEPKCPSCSFDFEWSDACPVEDLACAKCSYRLFGLQDTRCPECGTRFTWEQALENHRRSRSNLFEQNWRRRPVRSLLHTWFLALRPGRFWRTLDIHAPPQAGPLMLIWLLAIVGFIAAIVLVGGGFHWLVDTYHRIRSPLAWRWPVQKPLFHYITLAARNLDRDILLVVGIWCVALLASLLLFMQSMQRCRLRAVHVLRAWTYTTAVFLPVWAGLAYVYLIAGVYFGWMQWWGRPNVLPVLVFAVIYSAWAIRCAYRFHLRMPHSEGVAVSVQVITVMILLLAMARIGGVFSTGLTMQIFRALGLL